MNDRLPKGELVLLCNNSYLVEKVLYSNLRFEAKEILHKSLISMANVESFDSVLQLVSHLRSYGHASNWPISVCLGDKNYAFNFSGTIMHEHVVLSASVEVTPSEIHQPQVNSGNYFCELNYAPGKLAADDLVLMEEIKNINYKYCSPKQ